MAWAETARRVYPDEASAMQVIALTMNGLLSRRFCSR